MISIEFHSNSIGFSFFAKLQVVSSQWKFLYSTAGLAAKGASPAVLELEVRKPCSHGTQGTSFAFLLAVSAHSEHARRAAKSSKNVCLADCEYPIGQSYQLTPFAISVACDVRLLPQPPHASGTCVPVPSWRVL